MFRMAGVAGRHEALGKDASMQVGISAVVSTARDAAFVRDAERLGAASVWVPAPAPVWGLAGRAGDESFGAEGFEGAADGGHEAVAAVSAGVGAVVPVDRVVELPGGPFAGGEVALERRCAIGLLLEEFEDLALEGSVPAAHAASLSVT
jgi:hypothetical protein